ncbi:MAG TPA: TlpA disulfide reductase family protein [Acidimicrobiales bacterium]
MATRRLPLLPVVVATVLAVAAASAVFLLLGGGDGSSGASGSGDEVVELTDPITPEDLPTSTAEVELASLGDGPDHRLADYLARGRPVVLNFFASWCTPCLREMPAFEALHREMGDRVTVVGLAYQDESDRARQMVERTGVTYPTYADEGGRAIAFFGGTAMPTTVFIGADGEVEAMSSRELSEQDLRDQVADLLGADG